MTLRSQTLDTRHRGDPDLARGVRGREHSFNTISCHSPLLASFNNILNPGPRPSLAGERAQPRITDRLRRACESARSRCRCSGGGWTAVTRGHQRSLEVTRGHRDHRARRDRSHHAYEGSDVRILSDQSRRNPKCETITTSNHIWLF